MMGTRAFSKGPNVAILSPQFVLGDPLKGTLLNPTYGSLKGDLIERVYIPKGPLILAPRVGLWVRILRRGRSAPSRNGR